MKRFVAWLQGFALAIGAPGLFLITFLDSSFLSLPEIADLLLVLMVIEHPHRMILYAAMATAGSVAGCYAIYYIARKGGEAFVRRRFHERHVERGLELFNRYGVWALIVPSVLPPPAPFKIFVLLAGVAGMSPLRFAGAVAAGRGARYFGEALLAERAITTRTAASSGALSPADPGWKQQPKAPSAAALTTPTRTVGMLEVSGSATSRTPRPRAIASMLPTRAMPSAPRAPLSATRTCRLMAAARPRTSGICPTCATDKPSASSP